MAINLNPRDVRKVKVSTNSLPKTILGKNDRVKMVQGLEHGHTYKVDIKVIYNDWTEYNTTFTIMCILENRTVVEVKDNGERFGTFVLNLNSLIQENIKGKVQEQNLIYLKHMDQMKAEFDKKFNEEKNRADSETLKWKNAYQKELKRSTDLSEKYVTQKFELVNVENKLFDLVTRVRIGETLVDLKNTLAKRLA